MSTKEPFFRKGFLTASSVDSGAVKGDFEEYEVLTASGVDNAGVRMAEIANLKFIFSGVNGGVDCGGEAAGLAKWFGVMFGFHGSGFTREGRVAQFPEGTLWDLMKQVFYKAGG